MDYKVVVTDDAMEDLDHFVSYLLYVKKNEQAAVNLLQDFEKTSERLSEVAGNLRDCANPILREQGYKRIQFASHRYFMIYRIEGKQVIVHNIFHELQDYENKLS